MLLPGGLLTERISILGATQTRTSTGGWTDAWGEVASAPGRIALGDDKQLERLAGGQDTAAELVDVVLNLAGGVAVSSGHRLRDAAGDEYEVIEVRRYGNVAQLSARRV